jgi:alpha-tubulin suppressor-like RCC1 family protein
VPGGLDNVIAISAGQYHSLALKSDGTVAAWGNTGHGRCDVPADLDNVVAVSAGYEHSLALKSDGTVRAWGNNGSGQCNTSGFSDVVAIAAGWYHSVALKSDGTVEAVGNNNQQQCNVPAGLKGVVAIAAGGNHSLALKSDGTVVAWGYNEIGQCDVPQNLQDVVAIAAGGSLSLALKSDGTVEAWGDTSNDLCNTSELKNVVALAAGEEHALALKEDGYITAWGNNSKGQCSVPDEMDLFGRLSQIQTENASLTPAFQPGITSYVVHVSSRTTSLNISANLENPNHILKINRQAVASGEQVTVGLDHGENNVSLAVSIPSGITRTYTLTVIRSTGAETFAVTAPDKVKVGDSFSVQLTALNYEEAIDENYAGLHEINWNWNASASPSGVQPVKPSDGQVIFNDGIAVVDGFMLTKAGDTVTISAEDEDGITGFTDNPIVSETGRASAFVFELPDNINVGSPFAFTLRAIDAGGNTVTDYTGTISFSSNDPGAVLPADYTFIPGDQGRKEFENVTFNTEGDIVFRAYEKTVEGLMGHWKFDEGTGITAYDASGSNKNGTVNNSDLDLWDPDAPTDIFDNPFSVYLDGIDDYIEIPGIDLADKSFSISFWCKRLRKGIEWIIIQGIKDTRKGLHIGFRSDSQFAFAFSYDDLNISELPYDNDWHHWAVTFDAETKTRKAFRDGLLIGTDEAKDYLKSSGHLIIGKRNFDEGEEYYFKGNIDDLQIYSRVLREDEIAALAGGSRIGCQGKTDIYIPVTYTVTITLSDLEMGTVSGGGTYTGGQTVILSADPDSGYNFDGWYEGQTKLSSLPNYTFTAALHING